MKFQTAYARGIEDGQRKMREDWVERCTELTDACKARLLELDDRDGADERDLAERIYERGVMAGAVVAHTTMVALLRGKTVAELGKTDPH